jgi:hypothetical protein
MTDSGLEVTVTRLEESFSLTRGKINGVPVKETNDPALLLNNRREQFSRLTRHLPNYFNKYIHALSQHSTDPQLQAIRSHIQSELRVYNLFEQKDQAHVNRAIMDWMTEIDNQMITRLSSDVSRLKTQYQKNSFGLYLRIVEVIPYSLI